MQRSTRAFKRVTLCPSEFRIANAAMQVFYLQRLYAYADDESLIPLPKKTSEVNELLSTLQGVETQIAMIQQNLKSYMDAPDVKIFSQLLPKDNDVSIWIRDLKEGKYDSAVSALKNEVKLIPFFLTKFDELNKQVTKLREETKKSKEAAEAARKRIKDIQEKEQTDQKELEEKKKKEEEEKQKVIQQKIDELAAEKKKKEEQIEKEKEEKLQKAEELKEDKEKELARQKIDQDYEKQHESLEVVYDQEIQAITTEKKKEEDDKKEEEEAKKKPRGRPAGSKQVVMDLAEKPVDLTEEQEADL